MKTFVALFSVALVAMVGTSQFWLKKGSHYGEKYAFHLDLKKLR
jgi:hypothetical protein